MPETQQERSPLDLPEVNQAAPQPGVGETAAEQVTPVSVSTVARERMMDIIHKNGVIMKDCEDVLRLLNARPELDGAFCRLFGITNQPSIMDVSR